MNHERLTADNAEDGRSKRSPDDSDTLVTRRRILQTAGGTLAAVALTGCDVGQAPQPEAAQGSAAEPRPRMPDLTGRLARYMAQARDMPLSPGVVLATKHRILDTLSAIVSGARLKPGEVTIEYVRGQAGVPEASVATTDIMTSAVNAAFANAMFGHADETDDFHPHTKAHPGCSVVPAALAMGERQGSTGPEFLRAVALGYDLCCRILMALGPAHVRATGRAAEGFSATFGATAAAGSLARFDETQMRYAISYGVQQTSGVWSWVRDVEHIEKAFDFSGMGARNGVAAATMIQAGFTGVTDALDGDTNFVSAQSDDPRHEEFVADLGSRFYVEETAIKTFPVGYPMQSPLAAFFQLRQEHGLTVDNVDHILLRLPDDGARIVDNRAMPDVNIQHIMAVALVDGFIDFENSHAYERMSDPAVVAARQRVELIADPELAVVEAPRSGFVEVTLSDGRQVSLFVSHAPGTPENPLDTQAVNAKVRTLVRPILGEAKTEALIERVNALEELGDIRELRPLLTL
ncbi:MAG: MmgE/PrpD family protein [Acidobacteria bacterium]|nr:MmgE/PrpD family protein [Acidobacteriota bacterium]